MIETRRDIKVHFVGIGGIGMSGIAELLLSMGFNVSGSDIAVSANTEKLKGLGADIFMAHEKENIEGAGVVVYSSAIDSKNPEIKAAQEAEVPLMRRAEMLAELMRLKCGIAIGGTHGKTTTTSFLATILTEAKMDPTYIIGGIVDNLKGHARVGRGNFLVAEADESDGSFLLLSPIHAIITNIDNDHLDHYGSEEAVMEAFTEFANSIPFYGVCALNAHEKKFSELKKNLKKPWVMFGIDDEEHESEPEVLAKNIEYKLTSSRFELWIRDENQGIVEINIPGRHNVLNSLGAITIADFLGVPCESIIRGAKLFHGVGRRFQTLLKKDEFILIDDYGHHPTEILATLETIKKTAPDHKLIAIFEPHRFSRTRDCWDEFLHCFSCADKVYLSPIYPASEGPIAGVTSKSLCRDLNQLHPNLAEEFDSISNIGEVIEKYLNQKIIVVTLGAGGIGKGVRQWIKLSNS